MTINEYSSLSFDDRAAILWDLGMYLEDVDYYNQKVVLYSLFSFFVEVYYNVENNQIERLTVADEADLKKFLGRIDVKLS
jgi:hypothetical protein